MINALTKYQPLDVEKAKPIYNAEDEAVYIGSTMHHPYEDDKFILLSNPMTDDATFIEFKNQTCSTPKKVPQSQRRTAKASKL